MFGITSFSEAPYSALGGTSATVALTGVQGTTALGSEVVTAASVLVLTGVAGTGAVGDATVVANADVSVTGVAGTGVLDTDGLVVAQIATIYPTGLEATGSIGGVPDTFSTYAQAKISTAQYKFGGSSLYTDGSSDHVYSDQNTGWGYGDFTVEFWHYRVVNPVTSAFLLDCRSSSNNGFIITVQSNGQIRLIVNGGVGGSIYSSATLSTGAWHHIAVVREGTDLKLYLNGTADSTVLTNSNDYSDRPFSIGAGYLSTGYLGFNGYTDEFRGSTTARYTSNFTPATTSFSSDEYTQPLLHFDGANNSTTITDSAVRSKASVVAKAVVEPTGVEATGAVGSETVIADANIALSGISATTALGAETVTADVNIALTGLSATGATGSVALSTGTTLAVTGVEGTTAIGSETVTAAANIALTGVSATSSLGSEVVTATAVAALTGASATGAIGSETVVAKAVVLPSGVSATGALGAETVIAGAVVALTGVSATASLGSETASAGAGVSVTGLAATGAVGNVLVFGKAKVIPTAVTATGRVTKPVVWGIVPATPPSQSWTDVDPSAADGWVEVVPGVSDTWTKIAA